MIQHPSHLLLSAAAIGAAALALVSCGHKDKDAARTDARPEIEVAPVAIDSVTLYKSYPGTLSANRTVDVVARVDGAIVSKTFSGGEYFHKGDVLYTIEPTTYQNAVREAEASLATAKSTNAYAEQHYEAVKKAFASNAVSQMELIQAKSDYDQSIANISDAEAQLSTARTNLGYCTVRAPFDGHISTGIDVGSYVSGAGAPVKLATIYDDNVVYANFAIEDDSFQRMFLNKNNRHLIDYDSIPVEFEEQLPHAYTARLNYLAPDVSKSTGTMAVNAEIKNPYYELRPGMYVTVKLPFKVDPEAVLVRDASISTDQLGKYVYVVNDSNRVVYTPIKVGDLVNDTMRVVNSGLEKGQRYVTKAMLKVRDGMEVTPFEANTTPTR